MSRKIKQQLTNSSFKLSIQTYIMLSCFSYLMPSMDTELGYELISQSWGGALVWNQFTSGCSH